MEAPLVNRTEWKERWRGRWVVASGMAALFALSLVWSSAAFGQSDTAIKTAPRSGPETTAEFPPELVNWKPWPGNPIFTAEGPDHWDVKIRERGWILREGDAWKLWFTGYDGTRDSLKIAAVGDIDAATLGQVLDRVFGTLPATVRHFLRELGPAHIHPGDVLITNDAWMGTGHMSDVCVLKPIFHRGRLAAFSATTKVVGVPTSVPESKVPSGTAVAESPLVTV